MMQKILTTFSSAIFKLPTASKLWSESWYLSQYPDVASSDIRPATHFRKYGHLEGRLPCQPVADLWAYGDQSILPQLHQFAGENSFDGDIARWVLARWYASQDDWQRVLHYVDARNLRRTHPIGHGQRLLWLDALMRQGDVAGASQLLSSWSHAGLASGNDYHLVKANGIKRSQPDNHAAWLAVCNSIYQSTGLAGLQSASTLDALHCERVDMEDGAGLVSVIMPVHNGASWIATALNAMQAQTWARLELIVIDDASQDATAQVVQSFMGTGRAIRLYTLPSRAGTYAARNIGITLAQGEFITVHDADDWSHSQKIACQVKALMANTHAMASVSHWVRATADLHFGGWHTPENWNGWIHRNISSLMFRRQVIERLGFWDEVRCSADNEYYHRLMHVFGKQAIVDVCADIPLAIGRSHAQSLTQHRQTSIFSIFGGARKQYHQAFSDWHANASSLDALYLPAGASVRPFAVPEAMRCVAENN